MTLTQTIIEPNGPGGLYGDPIPVGIGSVCRTRRNQPPIRISFDPPRADLLGVEFGKMSDEEISAFDETTDAEK